MKNPQTRVSAIHHWPDLAIGLFLIVGTALYLGSDIVSFLQEVVLGVFIGLSLGWVIYVVRRLASKGTLAQSTPFYSIFFSLLFWLVFSYFRSHSLVSNLYITLSAWGMFHLISFILVSSSKRE
jgi:NhaP-type Na+/H+ or K+/H+ antiporter